MKVRYLPLLLLAACGNHEENKATSLTAAASDVPTLDFSVGDVHRHDTASYTEGLLFHDHQLFESSGANPDDPAYRRSMVGILDMSTGRIDKKVELDKNNYFGEGIAFFKNRLYQLTYKNQTGFIYDAATYKRVDSFRYRNAEGWALTTDSNDLIMSDGTSTLTWLDPVTCKPVKTLAVTENGLGLDSLNELEYINGYLYANRYLRNYIVKIDPATGKVLARLDLSSIVDAERARRPGGQVSGSIDYDHVLNGIAYDRENDKIYVTGKLWSGIYQLNFAH
jgi:glutamine cyclotransferase